MIAKCHLMFNLFLQVTSDFIIESVLYGDQGSYRCVARNTLLGSVQGMAESTFAALTVTRKSM